MIQYFYDKEAGAVIRLDDETLEMQALPRLSSPLNAPPPADMIHEEEVGVPAPTPQHTPRAKSGRGGCDECGSPSKHKRMCSRSGSSKDERSSNGARKPVKRAPCQECNSKGARHKKGCSKAGRPQAMTGNDEWARLEEQEAPKRPAMSQMIFGRVKISQLNDIPVDVIARNMDLDPADIEKVFEVVTYDEYKNL